MIIFIQKEAVVIYVSTNRIFFRRKIVHCNYDQANS